MRYSFHPEARLEYIAAASFYEQRRAGLGAIFTIEIESAIGRILESPMRWPEFEEDVRRCPTHLFPYGILHIVEQDSILIMAVMHCSRTPEYWKERLKRNDGE